MTVFKIFLVVFTLASSGCATFHAPSSKKELDPDKNYWMSYDASRRGAIVIPEDSKIRTCSEPAPDVALSFVNTLKGDFKIPNGSTATGVDVALNTTAMALAGRDNVVLLAREALFRICEASINGTIDPADVKPLFMEVFQKAAAIAEAQAEKSRRDADTEALKTQQLKLQLGK